jgi:hypothetical protein
MLDTRYFIVPAQEQHPEITVEKNEGALGAVWFVKGIRYVKGPVAEMKALDAFNPKDTAIVDNSITGSNDKPVFDSTASIRLVKYDNDAIEYTSAAATNQFAVFSEIYYPAGWNAYIDGKKTPYVKANYVLRAMAIPAGNHTITFKFEPSSYYTAQKLVYAGNILLYLAVLGAILSYFRKKKKVVTP